LDAHADNKTNKIIASVMFVFMMSPIHIVDLTKRPTVGVSGV
jgi:hypothetical protein